LADELEISSMLLITLVLAVAAVGQGQSDWFEQFPAHKVVSNVYYVGSKDLATFLITTPEGHILINSGFERTVPLIQKSVESLGFKMTDVKILLASHAHSDHVAGHALLQKLTGAKVYVMRGDDQVIASGGKGQYMYTSSRWVPCKVDRVLEDRDDVKLGGVTLVARLTPGHTRGCTTWTTQAQENGKTYDVVINCSLRSPAKLTPAIVDEFNRSFKLVRSLPCDVPLGDHPAQYRMQEKYAQFQKGGANSFIDAAGCQVEADIEEAMFHAILKEQEK
jgi:metallo-beta-lactamase class B